MYEITHLPSIIEIGTTGESNFRTFTFDMRPWLVNVPDGVASIVLIRPGESADDAYIAATTFTDGILTWTPAAADLGLVEGYGIMEIWLEETENNSLNKRGKSARVQTFVRQSMAQESTELPEPQETWLEQMTALKTQTVSAAIDAEDAKDDAVAAKEAAEQAASDLAAAVTAAEGYATAAAGSATSASGSATAAAGSATAAAGSATAAETAQGKAEDAQAAAETAQGEAWEAQAEALHAAEDAQDAAELAAGYVQSAQDAAATYPKIQTGTWWVYNATQGAWVDTGVSATGPQGSKGDTGERGLQGPTGSQGPKGDTGEKGDPFTIKKTFASIAEMEAYTGSDVTEGDFVAIASTVDDPDNAKLYLKSSNGYVFITDMSGVEGLKGDTGPKGDKGDKGDSGFSPKVNVSETASGHEITVIDEDGHETFEVIDGDSPIVSVTDITGGHRVTITDKNGTKTFDVMDGTDGDDGVSPTVTVTEITGGHQVAITDADGTSTFNVMDGEKGDPGEIPQETLDQIEDDITDLKLNKADIIVSSASGAIASFPDGAESTAKELVVGIEPVQEGSGDPSPDNVRPITGWTGANVSRTGKNLLNKASMVTLTGNPRYGKFGFSDYSDTKPNNTMKLLAGTYTLEAIGLTAWESVFLYDSDGTGTAKSYNNHVVTFSVPTDGFYGIGIVVASQVFTSWDDYDIQLELGSTASSYEPYHGQSLSISFPSSAGTVYGGSLTVNEDGTGKLVVDRAKLTLNTANMNNNEQYPGWNNSGIRDVIGTGVNGGVSGAFSNVSPIITSGYWAIGANTTGANDVIILSMNYFGKTQTEWQALAIDVQIVAELATPVTYQLTNQQVVSLLKGTNNVWADTGNVTLEYPADTKLFIEKKISELVSQIVNS